jgi:hypothetical protein
LRDHEPGPPNRFRHRKPPHVLPGQRTEQARGGLAPMCSRSSWTTTIDRRCCGDCPEVAETPSPGNATRREELQDARPRDTLPRGELRHGQQRRLPGIGRLPRGGLFIPSHMVRILTRSFPRDSGRSDGACDVARAAARSSARCARPLCRS